MCAKLTREEFERKWHDASVRQRAKEKQDEDEAIAVLDGQIIPTPDETVKVLNWRVGDDRQRILFHHAYWKEHKLREGFDALISAALAAHRDLCRCESSLTSYADSRDPFSEHVEQTVNEPAQKEVMAFCSACFGTIDTLRRLKSARPDLEQEIDARRIAATDNPCFRFILDLRRNLSHGFVTVPGWHVSDDFKQASGTIRFFVSELLAACEWGARSRAFLEGSSDGTIIISEVTGECARGLARLRRDLHVLFSEHETPVERDFHRIQDGYHRFQGRQVLKALLQPFADSERDPYPHLRRFFKPAEVREILRRPSHSAEQVELIISLKSPTIDCDPDLRELLYKLFRVT